MGREGSFPQYEAQRLHPCFLLSTPGYEEDMEKVSSIFTIPSFPLQAAISITFSLAHIFVPTHKQVSWLWLYPFLLQRCEWVGEGTSEGIGYLLIS